VAADETEVTAAISMTGSNAAAALFANLFPSIPVIPPLLKKAQRCREIAFPHLL